VDLARRHEDERACFDLMLARAVEELTFAAGHEVKLIAIMRLLWILSFGRVDLNFD